MNPATNQITTPPRTTMMSKSRNRFVGRCRMGEYLFYPPISPLDYLYSLHSLDFQEICAGDLRSDLGPMLTLLCKCAVSWRGWPGRCPTVQGSMQHRDISGLAQSAKTAGSCSVP